MSLPPLPENTFHLGHDEDIFLYGSGDIMRAVTIQIPVDPLDPREDPRENAKGTGHE